MAGAADIGVAAALEGLVGADPFATLVVVLATGRADQLEKLVIESLVGEVALLFGDPFLQPEMRLDDKFRHVCFLLNLGTSFRRR